MAMQIRGRHRGLPYALDRSVLLPSESIHKSGLAQAEQHIPLRQGGPGNRPRRTDLGTRVSGHQLRLPHGAVGEGEHAEHRLGIGNALSTLAGARWVPWILYRVEEQGLSRDSDCIILSHGLLNTYSNSCLGVRAN